MRHRFVINVICDRLSNAVTVRYSSEITRDRAVAMVTLIFSGKQELVSVCSGKTCKITFVDETLLENAAGTYV